MKKIIFLIALMSMLCNTAFVLPQPIYVIVCPEYFLPDIGPLIMLKEMQNFSVEVVSITTETAENIRENILNISPNYVLLIGDIDDVPTFYGIEDQPTDFYYVVRDNETIPFAYIGRLPASTHEDLTIMVNALLNYEYNYDSISLLLGSNAPVSTVNLNIYIRNDLANDNGLILYGDWPHEVILDAFNAGQAIMSYTGHGSITGWQGFSILSLPDLTTHNNIAFTYACRTANFGEDDSFGERFLMSGKAVVYIGSTYSTYWDEDDLLQQGMMESYYLNGNTIVGQILFDGLTYYSENYSGDTTLYWESMEILGDPSLNIQVNNVNLVIMNYIPLIAKELK